MTLIKALTFEGGNLTGSDAFDSTSGAVNAIESTNPLVGTRSYRIGPAGSSGLGWGEVGWTSTSALGLALYFRPLEHPTDQAPVVRGRNGTTQRFNIYWNSNGTLEVTRGAGSSLEAIGTTAALTLGVIYRLEVSRLGTAWEFRIAEGDDASTLIGTNTQASAAINNVLVGISANSPGAFEALFDEIHVNNDGSIPTLPALPVVTDPPANPPTGLAATWKNATEINVVWNAVDEATSYDLRRSVNETTWTELTDVESPHLDTGRDPLTTYFYQVRACNAGGCSDWSATVQAVTPDTGELTFTARGGVLVGGRVQVTAESQLGRVAVRGGVIVGGRIRVNVDRNLKLRGGVVVGGRIGINEAALGLRGGLVIGGRISITVETVVRLRGGVLVGGRAAVNMHRNLRLRGGVIVGGRDGYVGPGSGVVAAGARFNPNVIREGDTFNVYLPWAGLEGMGTLAHVKSRTMREDRAEQDLSLMVIPQPDPKLIPRMSGGGRPGLSPDRQDTARKQARQEREIDRIEREQE